MTTTMLVVLAALTLCVLGALAALWPEDRS